MRQDVTRTWRASGVDYKITLASLANTKGRMGEKADLGVNFARRYLVTLKIESGAAAPTAGLAVDLYWAPSHDNSTFPGGVTGSDAAYKDGKETEWAKQLSFIGSLIVTNDASTVQVQHFVFSPHARYGAPVVINNSGQTLETNDDEHRIILTPLSR